jgi:hypothetical protein
MGVQWTPESWVAVGTSPRGDAQVLRLGQTCSQPLYRLDNEGEAIELKRGEYCRLSRFVVTERWEDKKKDKKERKLVRTKLDVRSGWLSLSLGHI